MILKKINTGLIGFLCAVFVLMSFSEMPLMANWSIPPEVIYPASPPYEATTPYIATDGNGNSCAVWFDTNGSGSLQAATLAPGAVNGSGQPAWVLTNPVALSNVQVPLSSQAQAVGMDFNGTAIAIWSDGNLVYSSQLFLGQTIWSVPTVLNIPIGGQMVDNVCIAVAANGNAIASWISSAGASNATILVNIFDFGTQTWLGQTNLSGGNVEFSLCVNPAAVDPLGNGIISLTNTSNNIQAYRYNVNTFTWTPISSVTVNTILSDSCAMDPFGNALIAWIEQDNSIKVATLPNQANAFTNVTQLSDNADPDSYPLVTTDAFGNAVAIWVEPTGIGSARYTANTATWTVLPLLNLGEEPYNISLSGDANGNVVASWTIFASGGCYIQTAFLNAGSQQWSLLTQVSTSTDLNTNSHVVLTTLGDAVIIWELDLFSPFGTINSSIYLGIVDPQPPTSFTGKVTLNKFLNFTDRIHQLFWTGSLDRSIVAYKLYRNSVLISTQPAIGFYFSYDDHLRNKNVSDVYMLTSVNGNGVESTPLFVVLQ